MSHTTTGSLGATEVERLEQAHGDLLQLWMFIRAVHQAEPGAAALAEALRQAHAGIYESFDPNYEPLAALDKALGALGELQRLLAELGNVAWHDHALTLAKDCEKQTIEVSESVRRMPPVSPEPRASLRASSRVPALHPPLLAPLLPTLDLGAAQLAQVMKTPVQYPKPTTFGELQEAVGQLSQRAQRPAETLPAADSVPAESDTADNQDSAETRPDQPPTGFDRDPLPALTERQWVELNLTDCFTDVVALNTQRMPQLGDSWRAVEVVEQRLLANVDAIRALGDTAFQVLQETCERAVVVDAALFAGLALVAGCVSGRDVLALCERRLLASDVDEAAWQAVADTFKLVPNPLIAPLTRGYLRDPDPRKRLLALDVMGYRGWLEANDVERALVDPSLSRSRVVEHLPVLEPSQRHAWLRDLYADPQLSQQPALWWAGALCGYPAALPLAQSKRNADETGQAALLVALSGERRDAEQLVQDFVDNPTPVLAVALGWAGLGSSIPMLIAALATDDALLRAALAGALERMTGAGLFEEIEVAPEVVMEPDVPEPGESGPTLAAQLSDPRDQPEQGSPDTLVLPAQTQARWRAYWDEHSGAFQPQLRYRRGQLASPQVFVEELSEAWRTPGERRNIHRELVIRTGRRVRFDPHQWVSEQEQALQLWAAAARQSPIAAGTWGRVPMTE